MGEWQLKSKLSEACMHHFTHWQAGRQARSCRELLLLVWRLMSEEFGKYAEAAEGAVVNSLLRMNFVSTAAGESASQ